MVSAKLRDILNSKDIGISQFAEMCELPFETVKNVYYGRTTDPKLSTMLKMSEVLGVSVNELAGRGNADSDESILLNYFRTCGTHGQNTIILTAKSEAILAKYEREIEERRKILCIIPEVSVQEGFVYSECKLVDFYTTSKDAYIALKIIDNDFVPLYCKDDIVLLSNRFPKSGELGVFFIENRAYIKKYIECGNEHILQSIHGFGEDIVLKRLNNLEYIGTCIGVVYE